MARRHDQGHSPARAARPESVLEETTWIARFAEELRESGEVVFTLDHPLFQKYGVTEGSVSRLLPGTGGFGILRVSSVFVNLDGSRAPERWQDQMAHVKYSHREYTLVG